MSDSNVPPTDDELIARASAGTLIDLLASEVDHDRSNSLHNRTAKLHNDKGLDALALFQQVEFDEVRSTAFFRTQQVFCDLAPKLNASIPTMIAATKRLIEKAGTDGAAFLPLQALKTWLRTDLARAEQVIATFNDGLTEDLTFLAAALEVRNDPALAYPFMKKSDGRRQYAASALGQIKHASDLIAQISLAELLPLAESDTEDMIRFTAIYTMIEVLSGSPNLRDVWAPQIVNAVRSNPSDRTCEALLHGLWRRTALFNDQDVGEVLALAMAADVTVDRLREVLLITISHLVKTTYRDTAINCLTTLVEQGYVEIERKGGLLHTLQSEDRSKTFALVVRWFRSGKPQLCAAAAAVCVNAGRATPFDNDLSDFGLSAEEIIGLCKRVIGYLFVHPVAAASFLIAAYAQRTRRRCLPLLSCFSFHCC